MVLGKWGRWRHVFGFSGNAIAGISGGSTSAMMAALLDPSVLLSFQNTGREHPRTYSFLEEVHNAIRRPIVWLEYRPPPTKGGRPCESRCAVVTPSTADKRGGPFEMMMEALNAFRAKKGKGPIAPWWRSRICTAYMKTRTARTHVVSLGWRSWNEIAGLRADEPTRVQRLNVGHPKHVRRLAPLHVAGVTEPDVTEFWGWQTFRLGLPAHLGNCTGCFLKDQTDLSRALAEPETDAEWWARMEERWPMFGGRDFAGYRRLATETPVRLWMESELRAGRIPQYDGSMEPIRFRLVVIQERKRLAKQTVPFACECEGANTLAGMDDEALDQMVLDLPEAA